MQAIRSTQVFRLTVSLVLVMALAFIWSAAAQAQTSDAQYGSPANPVEDVLGVQETPPADTQGAVSSGGSALQAAVPSQAASGGASLTAASGGAPLTAASSGGVALLPTTGGLSLLFFAALLGCAMVGSGLLIMRRVSRQ